MSNKGLSSPPALRTTDAGGSSPSNCLHPQTGPDLILSEWSIARLQSDEAGDGVSRDGQGELLVVSRQNQAYVSRTLLGQSTARSGRGSSCPTEHPRVKGNHSRGTNPSFPKPRPRGIAAIRDEREALSSQRLVPKHSSKPGPCAEAGDTGSSPCSAKSDPPGPAPEKGSLAGPGCALPRYNCSRGPPHPCPIPFGHSHNTAVSWDASGRCQIAASHPGDRREKPELCPMRPSDLKAPVKSRGEASVPSGWGCPMSHGASLLGESSLSSPSGPCGPQEHPSIPPAPTLAFHKPKTFPA